MSQRKVFFMLIVFSFVCSILLSCNKKKFSGEWIAKIDNHTISIDMLNTYYYAQQKSIYNQSKEEIDKLASNSDALEKNPTLNKAEFLENLVRQRLVYNKAVEDGILDNEDVNALIQMTKETVVVGYYVKEKFKDEIEVTENEIENIYLKEKRNLRGVPIEEAEEYLKQRLFQQKLQLKIRDLVESLKEQSKIEKNVSLLQKNQQEQVLEESTR